MRPAINCRRASWQPDSHSEVGRDISYTQQFLTKVLSEAWHPAVLSFSVRLLLTSSAVLWCWRNCCLCKFNTGSQIETQRTSKWLSDSKAKPLCFSFSFLGGKWQQFQSGNVKKGILFRQHYEIKKRLRKRDTLSGIIIHVQHNWLQLHARHTRSKVHILSNYSVFQIRHLHAQQLQPVYRFISTFWIGQRRTRLLVKVSWCRWPVDEGADMSLAVLFIEYHCACKRAHSYISLLHHKIMSKQLAIWNLNYSIYTAYVCFC